jgi:CDP-glucose 4,6-dehydratase
VKIPAPVIVERDFWKGRRVLLTGHTGFKGSWLSLWLQSMGAHPVGLSPGRPGPPSLYALADIGAHMEEVAVDVRDAAAVRRAVVAAEPEVLFHLAAQPMVRRSLREPKLTYEVNVMGTVNVLEAARVAPRLRAIVVVTSDKCYENSGEGSRRFREEDALGGSDPYSSSKACAELVCATYRRSFLLSPQAPRLATARAGNVIGGGDRGQDRLMADVVRALETGTPLVVRNPGAVRPWQHVLSPLAGYLRLAQALCGETDAAARAWNFGPGPGDEQTVEWVLKRLAAMWGEGLRWEVDGGENPPEAARLGIDSAAAEGVLGWRPVCDLEGALGLLVNWQDAHMRGEDMRTVSLAQIAALG